MATAVCGVLGQDYQGTTYGSHRCYAGYNWNGVYYPYILKFEIPAFGGEAQTLSFRLQLERGARAEVSSSVVTLNWALLGSDANFSRYYTCAAVSDENQLEAGVVTFTGLSYSDDSIGSLTVAADRITGAGVYYLMLWGDNSGGYGQDYCVVCSTDRHVVELQYKNQYTLYISQDQGSTVAVSRNGQALTDGATVTWGEVLTVAFGAREGYRLTRSALNGVAVSSGVSHTVTGDVVALASAELLTFALTIDAGTGTTVTVSRNGQALADGATVSWGDELTIVFAAADKHRITASTVNGATVSTGHVHAVTGAVAVIVRAELMAFVLRLLRGEGTQIDAIRGGQALADGAEILVGEVLTIRIAPLFGHGLTEATVNGQDWTAGTLTVSDDVTVVASARIWAYPVGDGLYRMYVNGVPYVAYTGDENNDPVPLGTM